MMFGVIATARTEVRAVAIYGRVASQRLKPWVT
jgi:hypothetical protein